MEDIQKPAPQTEIQIILDVLGNLSVVSQATFNHQED